MRPIKRGRSDTGLQSSIEDQHQHKHYEVTDSPESSSKDIPNQGFQVPAAVQPNWMSPRQQSGETLMEFHSCPHHYHPLWDVQSTFCPPVEQRRSTWTAQPRILSDNAYGDLPPVQIKRNLQQGMDPIQEESSSMQAKSSQSAQVSINKEEDLGQMYSS